jgi:DNA-binding FrmR family transcriptional regulator
VIAKQNVLADAGAAKIANAGAINNRKIWRRKQPPPEITKTEYEKRKNHECRNLRIDMLSFVRMRASNACGPAGIRIAACGRFLADIDECIAWNCRHIACRLVDILFQRLQVRQKSFIVFNDFISGRHIASFYYSDNNGGRIMPLKKCCDENPSHLASIPRLNRAAGQLEGAKKMIGSNRYCPDILIQLRAARTAIKAAETEIFKRHLESCVANSFGDPKESAIKIAEIKKLLDFMN